MFFSLGETPLVASYLLRRRPPSCPAQASVAPGPSTSTTPLAPCFLPMSTSPPPPGEYRSTYTSRSPSSTALPSLPFTSEHSPLLAAHLDRGLSRSRSLPRGEGVETVVGDEDDDEGSTEEERPWWKGGRGAEGARGEQGGLRGARAKKRLGVLKARSRY